MAEGRGQRTESLNSEVGMRKSEKVESRDRSILHRIYILASLLFGFQASREISSAVLLAHQPGKTGIED